jgi:Rare lipoprotein B
MGGFLLRWVWSVLLLVSLSGCGFHLRGGEMLSPALHTMRLVGDDKSDMYRMVAYRLKRAGVTLVEKSEIDGKPIPELQLGGISVTNQVASVDSHSQAVEYVMHFSTQYSIKVPEHEAQKFTANFTRTFLNKSSEALASSREQEQLTREMMEQTADLVLIQLSRVSF